VKTKKKQKCHSRIVVNHQRMWNGAGKQNYDRRWSQNGQANSCCHGADDVTTAVRSTMASICLSVYLYPFDWWEQLTSHIKRCTDYFSLATEKVSVRSRQKSRRHR